MEKRYQVFLSSTYEDLRDERLEVLKALLELDCIPSGMEYFPAASEDQWTYIKELISRCDYYVVVIGGRYGSIHPSGVSYTQMEYEFAIEQGIPTIAFVHSDPSSLAARRTEQTADGKEKLRQFISLVRTRLCKDWTTAQDLGAVVSRSLTQLIRRVPRTGWVRADEVTPQASADILRLTRRVRDLEEELAKQRGSAPLGSELFAQGSDQYMIEYRTTVRDHAKGWNDPEQSISLQREVSVTWDEIFAMIAPELILETPEARIKANLGKLVRAKELARLEQEYTNHSFGAFTVAEQCVRAVTVQLRALGLIEITQKFEDGKPARFAMLTPLGERRLQERAVIRRPRSG